MSEPARYTTELGDGDRRRAREAVNESRRRQGVRQADQLPKLEERRRREPPLVPPYLPTSSRDLQHPVLGGADARRQDDSRRHSPSRPFASVHHRSRSRSRRRSRSRSRSSSRSRSPSRRRIHLSWSQRRSPGPSVGLGYGQGSREAHCGSSSSGGDRGGKGTEPDTERDADRARAAPYGARAAPPASQPPQHRSPPRQRPTSPRRQAPRARSGLEPPLRLTNDDSISFGQQWLARPDAPAAPLPPAAVEGRLLTRTREAASRKPSQSARLPTHPRESKPYAQSYSSRTAAADELLQGTTYSAAATAPVLSSYGRDAVLVDGQTRGVGAEDEVQSQLLPSGGKGRNGRPRAPLFTSCLVENRVYGAEQVPLPQRSRWSGAPGAEPQSAIAGSGASTSAAGAATTGARPAVGPRQADAAAAAEVVAAAATELPLPTPTPTALAADETGAGGNAGVSVAGARVRGSPPPTGADRGLIPVLPPSAARPIEPPGAQLPEAAGGPSLGPLAGTAAAQAAREPGFGTGQVAVAVRGKFGRGRVAKLALEAVATELGSVAVAGPSTEVVGGDAVATDVKEVTEGVSEVAVILPMSAAVQGPACELGNVCNDSQPPPGGSWPDGSGNGPAHAAAAGAVRRAVHGASTAAVLVGGGFGDVITANAAADSADRGTCQDPAATLAAAAARQRNSAARLSRRDTTHAASSTSGGGAGPRSLSEQVQQGSGAQRAARSRSSSAVCTRTSDPQVATTVVLDVDPWRDVADGGREEGLSAATFTAAAGGVHGGAAAGPIADAGAARTGGAGPVVRAGTCGGEARDGGGVIAEDSRRIPPGTPPAGSGGGTVEAADAAADAPPRGLPCFGLYGAVAEAAVEPAQKPATDALRRLPRCTDNSGDAAQPSPRTGGAQSPDSVHDGTSQPGAAAVEQPSPAKQQWQPEQAQGCHRSHQRLPEPVGGALSPAADGEAEVRLQNAAAVPTVADVARLVAEHRDCRGQAPHPEGVAAAGMIARTLQRMSPPLPLPIMARRPLVRQEPQTSVAEERAAAAPVTARADHAVVTAATERSPPSQQRRRWSDGGTMVAAAVAVPRRPVTRQQVRAQQQAGLPGVPAALSGGGDGGSGRASHGITTRRESAPGGGGVETGRAAEEVNRAQNNQAEGGRKRRVSEERRASDDGGGSASGRHGGSVVHASAAAAYALETPRLQRRVPTGGGAPTAAARARNADPGEAGDASGRTRERPKAPHSLHSPRSSRSPPPQRPQRLSEQLTRLSIDTRFLQSLVGEAVLAQGRVMVRVELDGDLMVELTAELSRRSSGSAPATSPSSPGGRTHLLNDVLRDLAAGRLLLGWERWQPQPQPQPQRTRQSRAAVAVAVQPPPQLLLRLVSPVGTAAIAAAATAGPGPVLVPPPSGGAPAPTLSSVSKDALRHSELQEPPRHGVAVGQPTGPHLRNGSSDGEAGGRHGSDGRGAAVEGGAAAAAAAKDDGEEGSQAGKECDAVAVAGAVEASTRPLEPRRPTRLPTQTHLLLPPATSRPYPRQLQPLGAVPQLQSQPQPQSQPQTHTQSPLEPQPQLQSHNQEQLPATQLDWELPPSPQLGGAIRQQPQEDAPPPQPPQQQEHSLALPQRQLEGYELEHQRREPPVPLSPVSDQQPQPQQEPYQQEGHGTQRLPLQSVSPQPGQAQPEQQILELVHQEKRQPQQQEQQQQQQEPPLQLRLEMTEAEPEVVLALVEGVDVEVEVEEGDPVREKEQPLQQQEPQRQRHEHEIAQGPAAETPAVAAAMVGDSRGDGAVLQDLPSPQQLQPPQSPSLPPLWPLPGALQEVVSAAVPRHENPNPSVPSSAAAAAGVAFCGPKVMTATDASGAVATDTACDCSRSVAAAVAVPAAEAAAVIPVGTVETTAGLPAGGSMEGSAAVAARERCHGLPPLLDLTQLPLACPGGNVDHIRVGGGVTGGFSRASSSSHGEVFMQVMEHAAATAAAARQRLRLSPATSAPSPEVERRAADWGATSPRREAPRPLLPAANAASVAAAAEVQQEMPAVIGQQQRTSPQQQWQLSRKPPLPPQRQKQQQQQTEWRGATSGVACSAAAAGTAAAADGSRAHVSTSAATVAAVPASAEHQAAGTSGGVGGRDGSSDAAARLGSAPTRATAAAPVTCEGSGASLAASGPRALAATPAPAAQQEQATERQAASEPKSSDSGRLVPVHGVEELPAVSVHFGLPAAQQAPGGSAFCTGSGGGGVGDAAMIPAAEDVRMGLTQSAIADYGGGGATMTISATVASVTAAAAAASSPSAATDAAGTSSPSADDGVAPLPCGSFRGLAGGGARPLHQPYPEPLHQQSQQHQPCQPVLPERLPLAAPQPLCRASPARSQPPPPPPLPLAAAAAPHHSLSPWLPAPLPPWSKHPHTPLNAVWGQLRSQLEYLESQSVGPARNDPLVLQHAFNILHAVNLCAQLVARTNQAASGSDARGVAGGGTRLVTDAAAAWMIAAEDVAAAAPPPPLALPPPPQHLLALPQPPSSPRQHEEQHQKSRLQGDQMEGVAQGHGEVPHQHAQVTRAQWQRHDDLAEAQVPHLSQQPPSLMQPVSSHEGDGPLSPGVAPSDGLAAGHSPSAAAGVGSFSAPAAKAAPAEDLRSDIEDRSGLEADRGAAVQRKRRRSGDGRATSMGPPLQRPDAGAAIVPAFGVSAEVAEDGAAGIRIDGDVAGAGAGNAAGGGSLAAVVVGGDVVTGAEQRVDPGQRASAGGQSPGRVVRGAQQADEGGRLAEPASLPQQQLQPPASTRPDELACAAVLRPQLMQPPPVVAVAHSLRQVCEPYYQQNRPLVQYAVSLLSASALQQHQRQHEQQLQQQPQGQQAGRYVPSPSPKQPQHFAAAPVASRAGGVGVCAAVDAAAPAAHGGALGRGQHPSAAAAGSCAFPACTRRMQPPPCYPRISSREQPVPRALAPPPPSAQPLPLAPSGLDIVSPHIDPAAAPSVSPTLAAASAAFAPAASTAAQLTMQASAADPPQVRRAASSRAAAAQAAVAIGRAARADMRESDSGNVSEGYTRDEAKEEEEKKEEAEKQGRKGRAQAATARKARPQQGPQPPLPPTRRQRQRQASLQPPRKSAAVRLERSPKRQRRASATASAATDAQPNEPGVQGAAAQPRRQPQPRRHSEPQPGAAHTSPAVPPLLQPPLQQPGSPFFPLPGATEMDVDVEARLLSANQLRRRVVLPSGESYPEFTGGPLYSLDGTPWEPPGTASRLGPVGRLYVGQRFPGAHRKLYLFTAPSLRRAQALMANSHQQLGQQQGGQSQQKEPADVVALSATRGCHQCTSSFLAADCEWCGRRTVCERCHQAHYSAFTYWDLLERCPKCRGCCRCKNCASTYRNTNRPPPLPTHHHHRHHHQGRGRCAVEQERGRVPRVVVTAEARKDMALHVLRHITGTAGGPSAAAGTAAAGADPAAPAAAAAGVGCRSPLGAYMSLEQTEMAEGRLLEGDRGAGAPPPPGGRPDRQHEEAAVAEREEGEQAGDGEEEEGEDSDWDAVEVHVPYEQVVRERRLCDLCATSLAAMHRYCPGCDKEFCLPCCQRLRTQQRQRAKQCQREQQPQRRREASDGGGGGAGGRSVTGTGGVQSLSCASGAAAAAAAGDGSGGGGAPGPALLCPFSSCGGGGKAAGCGSCLQLRTYLAPEMHRVLRRLHELYVAGPAEAPAAAQAAIAPREAPAAAGGGGLPIPPQPRRLLPLLPSFWDPTLVIQSEAALRPGQFGGPAQAAVAAEAAGHARERMRQERAAWEQRRAAAAAREAAVAAAGLQPESVEEEEEEEEEWDPVVASGVPRYRAGEPLPPGHVAAWGRYVLRRELVRLASERREEGAYGAPRHIFTPAACDLRPTSPAFLRTALLFQQRWGLREPVVARGCAGDNPGIWQPQVFRQEVRRGMDAAAAAAAVRANKAGARRDGGGGDGSSDEEAGQRLKLIDCANRFTEVEGDDEKRLDMFFELYDKPYDKEHQPMMLKLKDYPPASNFHAVLSDHFKDFISLLPLPHLTRPDHGPLNLATVLAPGAVPTDLGPKAYIAFGTQEEYDGPAERDSVTKLHMDMSDAVNVLNHILRPAGHNNQDQQQQGQQDREQQGRQRDSQGGSQGAGQPGPAPDCPRCGDELPEVPGYGGAGAVWDIWAPGADTEALRSYLAEHKSEFVDMGEEIKEVHDAIFDQTFFVRREHRDRLWRACGVSSWHFEQYEHEAVFIPAGCPHQVRNLTSCIKTAVDFVSPEAVAESLDMAARLRHMPREPLTPEYDALADRHVDRLQGLLIMLSAAVENFRVAHPDTHRYRYRYRAGQHKSLARRQQQHQQLQQQQPQRQRQRKQAPATAPESSAGKDGLGVGDGNVRHKSGRGFKRPLESAAAVAVADPSNKEPCWQTGDGDGGDSDALSDGGGGGGRSVIVKRGRGPNRSRASAGRGSGGDNEKKLAEGGGVAAAERE